MRVYKRRPQSRSYASFSAENLTSAKSKVTSGQLSCYAAAKKYGIPYGTLYNKLKNKHTLKTGGQITLPNACERSLLRSIDLLAEWKVPMTGLDIRLSVKEYLDHSGVNNFRFKQNCPGVDWLRGFIARHKLSKRLADNVKPARAEITREAVITYFDNLEASLAGVEPNNLVNYDETNVTDEPGAIAVVCRRGLRRVERKIQHSKAAISLMYCGSASGEFLPPMVVYKSKNCYLEWTRRAPEGTIFDCSKSGWFDARCFERWFTELFLPQVEGVPGTKVLIGDNLASHFTQPVIQACVDNDIRFVCLIPNATHLLQPLDVAVFRPLKIAWRSYSAKLEKGSTHLKNIKGHSGQGWIQDSSQGVCPAFPSPPSLFPLPVIFDRFKSEKLQVYNLIFDL